MADAPKKKGATPAYGQEVRDLAFQIWLENQKPSLRELVELLAAKGYKVNITTVMRWKDANPAWCSAFLETAAPVDPIKVLAALTEAKADAKAIHSDHFVGIKVQLIARLYLSIKRMEFRSIDEWERALNCCDRLEALIHTERGKTVAAPTSQPVASLMQALAPPVNIAPFKKPNGGSA